MLDVTVKTLDGRNRSFSVPDDITVKEFKEKIAPGIEISADTQRLIYQGRVLQDDKKLNDYDVNGKTLHVVQRAPPTSRNQTGPTPDGGAANLAQTSSGTGSTQTFVGSFTLPSNMVDANQVQNIVQNVLSGMGDVGRNARISTRSADDGSAVDVHIHLGQFGGAAAVHSQSNNRLRMATRMLNLARQALTRLENPTQASATEDSESIETSAMDSAATGDTAASEDADPQVSSTPNASTPPEPVEGAALLPDTVEVQLEEVVIEALSEDQAEEAELESDAEPEPQSEPTSTPAAGTTGAAANTQTPQHPRLSSLADTLEEVASLHQRLQPHLDRYQTFLRNDPVLDSNETSTSTQRMCQNVSEVLHCISHIYHNLSDLIINTQQAPPRFLRATPIAHPAAVIQQTIPVQAQINVAHVSPSGSPHLPRRSNATTVTTPSSSTPTSTARSTTPSSNAQPHIRPGGPFSMRLPMPPRGIPTAGVQGSMPHGPRTAFGPGGQPYMFMEFGPHGMAISSVTSHVVSGGSPTTTNAAPQMSAGSVPPQPPQQGAAQPGMPPFLPQNFLQNVMQMAQQAATGQVPSGGQQVFVITQGGTMPVHPHSAAVTASSSTGSSTTTSSASSTPQPSVSVGSSTPTPGPPPLPPRAIPLAGIRPGLPGGLPFMNPVDPYLPCQSRFFLRRQAAAAAAASQASQPSGQSAVNTLAGTVSNLISSMISQNLQGGAPAPASTAASRTSTARATTATSAAQPNLVSSAGATAPSAAAIDPPSIQALRAMLQSASQVPSSASSQSQTSTTTTSQTGAERPGAAQPMGDEMFAQLVRGIGNYVSQAAMGQQASDSIYEFINTLGHDPSSNGEGLLSDIFMCVSQHLTIVDLMSIFCQQTAPLQRLAGPLQVFIRDKVLQGQPDSEANIDSSVERLTEEMLPQVEEMCADVRVRDNIDYPASIQELLRHHLGQVCRLVLNASENDPEFGRALFNNIRNLMHEFLVLSRCCLEEGTTAVERMVQANVHRITADINPMIQQWMTGMTTQQLQGVYSDIGVTESQIQQYIVRRADTERRSTRSSDSSFVSAEGGDDLDSPTIETSSATEVPACGHIQPAEVTTAETMEVDSEMVPSPTRNHDDLEPHIDPAILARLPAAPTAGSSDNVPVVVGSESWHSQVPQEWVSVITNDVHRQQRQPKQPPFSDAYLNGMPAKRRKLMSKSASSDELNEPQQLLPEAVQKAAQAAGAEPISSPDEVARDAAASSTLRESFQQEMSDSIRKRMEGDSDYIPEKYPNAEKYYKGKNK